MGETFVQLVYFTVINIGVTTFEHELIKSSTNAGLKQMHFTFFSDTQ